MHTVDAGGDRQQVARIMDLIEADPVVLLLLPILAGYLQVHHGAILSTRQVV